MPERKDQARRAPLGGTVDVETEVGATSGRTHHEVLDQALGPERAHEALVKGGPPAVDPARLEKLRRPRR